MKKSPGTSFLPLMLLLAAMLIQPAATIAAEGPAEQPAVAANSAEDHRVQLAEAKKDAALIEASPNYAANAPAIATEDELKIRRYYARETVRAYETLLRNLARRDELRRALEDAKRQAEKWTAVPGGPPYSVLVADQLAHEAQATQNALAAKKTRLELTRSMRDSMSQAVKTSAVLVRQLEEQAPRASGAQRVSLDWALEMARYRLRTQAAILKSLDAAEEVAQGEIAIAQSAAEFAQRKTESVQGKVVFPEADYKLVKDRLAAEGAAVSAEFNRAIDAAGAATSKVETAREAQAQAQAAVASARATEQLPSSESLRQAVAQAEVDMAATNAMLDVLRYKPGVQEMKRVLWDFRYRLYHERTPALVAEARAGLDQLAKSLEVLLRVGERRMAVLRAEITEIEQLLPAVETEDARRLQAQVLARDTELERTLRQITAFYVSAQWLMERLRDEVRGEGEKQPAAERVATAAHSGKQALASLWDFEIFAIEESVEVDGRKVATLSSITVGKVVRALLIFTAGVLLSYWLGLAAEALVVRRFGYDAARARILRKWLFALGLLVLLVAVLLWVHIPLTVFAFLGGAVAIGLGFGMRNLLQNLISGLMLLFERPFKPGDLVEVGSIRGNIVEIGIRSSVIRDPNGVDSLIPNSTFIEQNVTNWTYENPRVRFCIKVGIAYGSPVDDAARLLAECVERHGLVLEEPAPEILFEDFGADALNFAAYYWLELGPKVVARRVASDLRFMIEKSLREHDIIIAYPQRDVHLDAATPLRVQVVKD